LPFVVLCMALLAIGQGIVIRSGGLDLSMPSMIAFAGVAITALTQGHLDAFPQSCIFIAFVAIATGLWHGWLTRHFDRGAIAGTLATAGILQVAMAWLAIRLPTGFTPPELTRFVTGENGSTSLLVWGGWLALLIFAFAFDRKARSGSSSGAYVLSALCSAAFGIAMAVLAGQFHAGLGEVWLAPTMAALMLGGIVFRQTSGRLAGIIGGVLLVQALDTTFANLGWSSEQRLAVFGLIMLAASIIAAQRAQFRLKPRSSTVRSESSSLRQTSSSSNVPQSGQEKPRISSS
jgi:ribose transport system permease protein